MSAIIRVTLSRKALQIEPGQQGELTVTIHNLSEIVDQYIIEVEGLDRGWFTVSPPRISLFPQDEEKVTVKLHPPLTAPAGKVDFAVKVVSRENPVEWSRAEATLDVTPVFLFDLRLSPQQQTIVKGEGNFNVELTNPGNVELTLNLSASDPEEGCTYRFRPAQATIEAGGTADVGLTVTPKQHPRDQAKLYNFTVKATPVGAPQRARTTSGQLQCQAQVVSLDIALWPRRRSAVGAGTFQVQLDNRGNTDLTLILEGTDPEEACAYRFEPAQVRIGAGESKQVPLTVAPIGRQPTEQARQYDFVVRAVPQKARHKVVQAEGQLECLPVVISFDMDILPGERSVRKEGEFQVRLVNRSEAGLSVELSAGDEAGAFDYGFERRRVSVDAGETKRVPLTVTAREIPDRGETLRHPFSVEAKPADAPHLAKRSSGRLEVTQPRGWGILIWSIVGFALGNGVLNPLMWSGVLPDSEATIYLLFAAMGAIGGLLLSIGVRRRVLLTWLAGALGFAAGGILVQTELFMSLPAQAAWGAVAGGLLGLALKYGWRAIGLAAAGALALPLRVLAGEALWSTPLTSLGDQVTSVLIDVIIGALAGLLLGLAALLLERWRDRRKARAQREAAES